VIWKGVFRGFHCGWKGFGRGWEGVWKGFFNGVGMGFEGVLEGVLERLTFIQSTIAFTTHLKFTLSTAMVTTTESVTSIMVKSRYFPSSGTVSEVGGMISASRRKNTVSDSRMLIQSEIFSPESLGR